MYLGHRRSSQGGEFEIDDSFRKWVLGLVVPTPILIYAIICIISRHAVFGGGRGTRGIDLNGVGAIAYGVMVMGFTLFGHFHCFWGECKDRESVAVIGKIVSFLLVVAGFGTLLWSIIFS
jgi:hypothetical protein